MNAKILISGILFLFAVFLGQVFLATMTPRANDREGFGATRTLRINDAEIAVVIADTYAARVRGLSGTAMLGPDEGMWFVFPSSEKHGIWMHDMRFPIDIIWLDDNQRVIDLKLAATPDSYPEIFTPAQPARYVLEVPAGFAVAHAVSIGDRASFADGREGF